ncbi:DsbC family protein [Pseudomonas qingdaonensis]|uniref:DsbC family protein n=1 Tax=Pseudomonas qingdaonensis TaxID=2056231 RepID=UPI002660515C|nr:DsbC family protein [Pseudomonas qingdaonensis]WKL67280.1 DsbC family protein [Pseudomonas qingdaonensis]
MIRAFPLTLAALAIGVSATAAPLENKDNIVMLPVAGMLAVEKNGKFAIVSDNGRFIIQGKVYDTWSQKELQTLEEARAAANYIPIDKAKMGFEDLAPMSIGTGDKVVTMFSDPACKFCKEIMEEARTSLPEGYRLDVLMLPLLSERSATRTTELHCAQDPAAAWKAAVKGDLNSPLAQKPAGACELEVIGKRRLTAQFIGARNVPFLVRDDGLVRQGKPAEGLRAWIESNRAQ